MNIARTMKKVEELSSLCHGAKQGIVTPCPFLHLIETNCRPLRMALGGLNRTIKVKGQPIKRLSLQSLDHHSRGQFTDLLYTLCFHLTKRSRNGGYVGKSPQPHQPKHQRIIPVIVDLPQTTKTYHKVHNQKQDNQVAPKDGTNLDVLEALLQTFSEPKPAEQYLKDQQPGERS